jgi:hypothetical protein
MPASSRNTSTMNVCCSLPLSAFQPALLASLLSTLPLHATAQVELDIKPDDDGAGDGADAPPDRSLLFTSSHKEVRVAYGVVNLHLCMYSLLLFT